MKWSKKGEKLLTLDRVNRPKISDMQSNQKQGKDNPEFPD